MKPENFFFFETRDDFHIIYSTYKKKTHEKGMKIKEKSFVRW